jgi:ferrochelatase
VRAVLLLNLGSPASPAVPDVRRYLGEFLMDPYVLDAPWPIRRAIVSLAILPFRPAKSAEAYASIWTAEGSPLLAHGHALTAALDAALDAPVELAMRYGEPSIDAALQRLRARGATSVLLAPLYPQHADSTCTTSIVATRAALARQGNWGALEVLPPFHADAGYLDALAEVSRPALADADHVLFTYHGLPERHLRKADPTGSHCLARKDCCETPSPAHATCYRQQCFATTRALVQRLGLRDGGWSQSFQSRLGRIPWLRPYTDEVLAELPARGVRRLAVVCPAFVADNLETLEEIGMRGRETFLHAGGEAFTLAPCLNEDPRWVSALAALVSRAAGQPA